MSITKYDPLYISGLLTSWGSATTIGVAAGECTSTTDPYPLLVSSGALTIDTAGNGALGLAGSEVLTDYLFWQCCLIMKADGTVSAFAKGSATGAVSFAIGDMPTDYIYWRPLPGIWRQAGGALAFQVHTRYGRCGVWVSGGGQAVLGTGHQTSRTSVSLAAYVPIVASMAEIEIQIMVKNATINKTDYMQVFSHLTQGGASIIALTVARTTNSYGRDVGRGLVALDTAQTAYYICGTSGGTPTWANAYFYGGGGWTEDGE
jgi:hypothetical protein